MKTLLVTYLPRGERSHTKALADAFVANLPKTEALTTLDLCAQLPSLFTPERIAAYIARSYLGETLSGQAQAAIEPMDAMTEQLVAADALVIAGPMHNFSLSAVVKAWLDSVILKGKTWDAGPNGYTGLMTGKPALFLWASGGLYDGEYAAMNHLSPTMRTNLAFMGFDPIREISIQGVNADPDGLPQRKSAALEKVRQIAQTWPNP